jgi:hypothetical protein
MSGEPLGAVTWAGLLAQWTEFARATGSLRGGEGERWRSSAAPIIGLQAVTFALADLGRVGPGDERALALDRAEITIRTQSAALHEIWRGEAMSEELAALIGDARAALEMARGAGVQWLATAARVVLEHPAALVEDLLAAGFDGDLWVGAPGVPLFAGSPVAFVRGRHGGSPAGEVVAAIGEWLDGQEFQPAAGGRGAAGRGKTVSGVGAAEAVGELRQVYRQFDFSLGRAVRDVVVGFGRGLAAGQPLLVEAVRRGEGLGVPMSPRRGEMLEDLEVVDGDEAAGG